MNFWANSFERRPMLTGLLVIGLILIVVGAIGLSIDLLSGPRAKVTNPSKVEQKVYDPNNTIAQIAFFHNTCNQAVAQLRIVTNNQKRLAADQQAAKLAKDPIRQQQAIDALTGDQQDVTGAEDALQSTVADYNSRSAQRTANVFKGTGLPVRINLPDPIPVGYTINCG